MSKKEDVTIEGVNLNIKHLQGLSQADFAEKMNSGGYKHLWADSENRDAIVAEAYAQINPKAEATTEATQPQADGAAMSVANGDGATSTEAASDATETPKGRRSK